MVLEKGQICWKPDLGDGNDDDIGVLRMLAQWSKRYLSTGDLMKRLDVGEGTYGREIEEDYDVLNSMSQLQQVRRNWSQPPGACQPEGCAKMHMQLGAGAKTARCTGGADKSRQLQRVC